MTGTVEGDVHRSGRDLAATMLEGAGFTQVDAGSDGRSAPVTQGLATRIRADAYGADAAAAAAEQAKRLGERPHGCSREEAMR
jgi:methanogenic corrinoid protein MtbC1